MARTPRTAATTTPTTPAAPVTTPTPAAVQQAAEVAVAATGRFTLDLDQLVAGVTVAAALPAVTRNGRDGRVNPLTELVKRSFAESTPFTLPPVPATRLATLTAAVRRAAQAASLGVTVRHETNSDGAAVITFQAKDKRN